MLMRKAGIEPSETGAGVAGIAAFGAISYYNYMAKADILDGVEAAADARKAGAGVEAGTDLGKGAEAGADANKARGFTNLEAGGIGLGALSLGKITGKSKSNANSVGGREYEYWISLLSVPIISGSVCSTIACFIGLAIFLVILSKTKTPAPNSSHTSRSSDVIIL